MAAAGALAVIETIEKKKLLTQTKQLGDYLEKRLQKLRRKYEVIDEVRGLGLMRALQLNIPGVEIARKAMEQGLLINCTQEKVLRIMPAMTISKKVLSEGLGLLEKAFEKTAVATS